MRSPHESRAATRSWIHAACDHRGNELPDRVAVAEVFQWSSTLRPKAFLQASSRLRATSSTSTLPCGSTDEIAFSTLVRNSLVSLLLSASAASQDFRRRSL